MTLLPAKLYNILTLDFSTLFANVPSNASAIKVGCILNTIFDSLTKAVTITFHDFLQLSSVVIVLHEIQIISSSLNCCIFPLHSRQTTFSLKESNSKLKIVPVTLAILNRFWEN